MAISATTPTTGATTTQTTTDKSRASLNATFDQFLTMLTTQMKYQDPLSPLDSNQFTQQLVSFSQVEQQLSTNDKLDKMLAAQSTGGLQGALQFIGHKVEAETSYLSYDGSPVKLAYGFDKAASEASVKILTSSGSVVKTITPETGAGRHEFTWDGTDANGNKVADGTYVIQATAKDGTGAALTPWTTVTGVVTGVDGTGDTTQILVGDVAVAEDKIVAAWQN